LVLQRIIKDSEWSILINPGFHNSSLPNTNIDNMKIGQFLHNPVIQTKGPKDSDLVLQVLFTPESIATGENIGRYAFHHQTDQFYQHGS
jgi:hypothetical protein